MRRLKDLLLQENFELTTITTSKAEAHRLLHHWYEPKHGCVADGSEQTHALGPQQPA